MTELSEAELKAWVKDFAQKSGLLSSIGPNLEEVIRLFDSRLQRQLTGLRPKLSRDYPIGSEWLADAISGQRLTLTDTVRQEFKDYLIEGVLATDIVLIVTGSGGHRLKISLETQYGEYTPTDKALNQNLLEIRKALGIGKHLVLLLENQTDKLPNHNKLLKEIDNFSTESQNVKILNLSNLDPWDLYNWRKEQEADPGRMWSKYSDGIVANASNLIALEAAKRAFRDFYTSEAVIQMLTHDPTYRELLNRDGGNRKFADIHAKAISLGAEIEVAQEPPQQAQEQSPWDQVF